MRFLVLVLLAGCDLIFELEGPPPTLETAARRTITIAQPTGQPLASFPVGIFLTSEHLLARRVKTADEIRFVTTDGLELHSEIIYDADTGELEAWVQIETLPATPVDIRIEYGPGVVHATNPKDVWTNQYVSVWHLSDRANGIATDSANDINGPNPVFESAPSNSISAPGIAGRARAFDGDDQLCSANPIHPDFQAASLSWSAWVFIGEDAGAFDQPIAKGAGSAPDRAGFNFELNTAGGGANLADVNANVFVDLGTSIAGRWVHLVATVDRTTNVFELYLDTAMRNQKSLPGGFQTVSSNTPVCIGGDTDKFHGMIDEVRIYNGAIGPERVVAETLNLTDPSFVQVGDEEELVLAP